MKISLVILAAVSVLVAAVFAVLHLSEGSASTPPTATAKPSSCGADAIAVYGHVKSLTPKGDHYELRFDPALFLSGVTASRAALEDTGSSDVPNDNYVVEESHRLYTYLVPTSAHITVLSRTGTIPGPGYPSTAITSSQLAQLVKGEQPVKLAETLESGFWMRYNNDTVCSLEQQYRP